MKPFVTCLFAASLAFGLMPATTSAQPATAPSLQTSSQAGVTVKVKAGPQPAGGEPWLFSIVLDTHSQDLSDDLMQASVLVADGRELKPASWTGAQPGGHHREGVLAFTAPEAPVSQVELRIQRAGEAQPRVFRWDGAALRQP